MQWAMEHVPSSYLYASADDDFVVDIPVFFDTLRSRVREKGYVVDWITSAPIYCVHSFRDYVSSPIRARYSKWYTHSFEYKAIRWPVYCTGGWYFMGMQYVLRLYNASLTRFAMRMDDVWITGVLRETLPPFGGKIRNFYRGRNNTAAVKHLWGDFSKVKNISYLLHEKWTPIRKKMNNRTYCLY